MNPAEYRIRCRMAESCLPDAEYRARLTALHDDMLTEIEALREALLKFVAWSEAERNHEGTTFWERVEMLRDLDEAADTALARAGEKT